MRFDEFVFYSGTPKNILAKRLDVDHSYLCMIVSGKMKPGKKLAKRIEILTEGRVTFDELMNPPEPMITVKKLSVDG